MLGYYTWVGRNAAFYGVSTTAARRATTFDEALGSDWVHVAELAAAGTIRRVPTTIHRSTAGKRRSSTGACTRFARPIAKLVAADIRTGMRLLASSGPRRARRWRSRAQAIIYWRKGVLYWRELLTRRVRRAPPYHVLRVQPLWGLSR